jgi:hypothetical protein
MWYKFLVINAKLGGARCSRLLAVLLCSQVLASVPGEWGQGEGVPRRQWHYKRDAVQQFLDAGD